MNLLEKTILEHGKSVNNVALDASSFLTKQIDIQLLDWCATQFNDYFKAANIDRILTIESGGIAISTLVALKLNVPLVVMKKNRSMLDPDNVLTAEVYSFTKNVTYELHCNAEHINEDDRILFIDDVLAHGNAVEGTLDIIAQRNGTLAGVGILFEKSFQSGAGLLAGKGIDTLSLAKIKSLENGIHF
ncbi:xanthine phosphoribosyltransferase [Shewanella benthica]|uniref:xanthine phosphoribosyltransferase n=1 Tax=Shewanella benthica TaxID=43661 RepID=UPI00187AF369|nr:xanthine phosphoribosyltransferase [Shewanella benthica]MBE7215186.1 xanthine phosphoribosyltransferase [Shewanella benthica]MCL1062300.1 xanthine phosphoribosyltransferase [Shewanella benthica]